MAYRGLGMQHPTEWLIPQPPDSVQTLLIAGSSGQAMDWFSTGVAQANAAAADIQFVRFTGVTTAGATLNFMVNLYTTQAAAPSSGSSNGNSTNSGSSGVNHPVQGNGLFQLQGQSTGFSVAALSSGYIMVEAWKRN